MENWTISIRVKIKRGHCISSIFEPISNTERFRIVIKHILNILFLWICLVFSVPSLSENSDMAEISALKFIEDHHHHFTVDEVKSNTHLWQISDVNGTLAGKAYAVNRGFSHSTWWFHFSLKNTSAVSINNVLSMGIASLDLMDVYEFSQSGVLRKKWEYGDLSNYPVNSLFWNELAPIEIQLEPFESVDYIVKIRSQGLVQFPINVAQNSTLEIDNKVRTFLDGMVLGLLSVALVYGFILWRSELDKVFLAYLLVLLGGFIGVTFIGGGAHPYIPELLKSNAESIACLGIMWISIGLALFSTSYWQWGQFHPDRHQKMLRGTAIFGSITLSFVLLMPSIHFLLASVVSIAVSSLAIYYGVRQWRQKRLEARLYILYNASYLVLLILLLFVGLGWVAFHGWSLNVVQVMTIATGIVGALTVFDRNSLELHQRLNEQHQAYRLQKQSNELLLQKVNIRADELIQIKQQLEDISKIDPITGLKNKRYLDEVLEQEFARCQRYQRSLAIINVDIDQIDSLQAEHGELVMHQCLKALGDALKNTIRSTCDLAVHHDRAVFYLVLPETYQQGTVKVVEKIQNAVSTVKKILPESPIDMLLEKQSVTHFTASIGIYVKEPDITECVDDFLNNADFARYCAKKKGSNQVVFYDQKLRVEMEKLNVVDESSTQTYDGRQKS